MKKAIGYVRISKKDQSHFSLTGQEKYVRNFADQQGLDLIDLYTDDGISAKNFDRPDWKKMESFLSQNYRNVDYLIVVKYDRFSRNAADGLKKIELIEKKYNIIILSVFEQMYVDSDSPFFFKQRADMLVNAEFEWHVIRDRTRFGIHSALTNGRFVNRAPFGYVNEKDDSGKPIINLHPEKSKIVDKIFKRYLSGMSITEIGKLAIEEGFTIRGRSAISRVLTNPTYAGLILVPAYRKDPEHYVKGIHKAIVDEDQWHRIQYLLNGRKKDRLILNDEVPLRGVVNCFCGKCLTAGKSKGKNKYYWYYKCNNHKETNLSANVMHAQFDEILRHLSLRQIDLKYIKSKVNELIDAAIKNRVVALDNNKKELIAIRSKISSLEEKFISNQINADTYHNWYNRFKDQENALVQSSINLNMDIDDKYTLISDNIEKLGDLHFLYHEMNIFKKQSFIKTVFNSSLYYAKGIYRTPFLLPILSHNSLILNEKRLLLLEQPLENSLKNQLSSGIGS